MMIKSVSPQAGIAIGPILFIIALLGVLVAALSSGTGSYGSMASEDRIKADLRSQANLIRSKVQECYMATVGNALFDYPDGPTPGGTVVRNLTCPGDPSGMQNIWSGKRATALPPIPKGFSEWTYFNYGSGRCVITTPTATPSLDVKNALKVTAGLFSDSEVYLNTGTRQSPGNYSFSVWLTPLATAKVCGT